MAVISIALNRASARLDFIHRNLKIHARKATNGANRQDGQQRTDIVLVLTGEPSRLPHIFDLQKTLFEDFQVERTELMVIPQCVAEAARHDKYYVRVITRLLNNRTTVQDNRDFIENLEKYVSRLKAGFRLPDYVLARIPGLSDYDIRFETPVDVNKASNLYRNILNGIVQRERVDRFRTIVG